MQLTISQLTAAGLEMKSWEDDRRLVALCIDRDPSRRPGKAVYVVHQVDTGKLSESNTVQALYTDRYVENVGYQKSLLPPTFTAGVLVGWYWDTLPDNKRTAVFNWNQVAAIEGGANQVADARLELRTAAENEIAQLEATYGRGGAVPYENIVIYGHTTLAGQIAGRKAFYNQMALQYPGGLLFPEANGAHVGGALNFPPPDGTIQLGTGDAPIGVELNSASTPTRNEGPWPIGAHSAYRAPANAWRAGKPAPPPFRFPNPKLYYGPSGNFTGLDPQSGTQSTVDPTRDLGTEGPPPAPVTPMGGPPPATGTNVPAPSPDDALSLPVSQDPGGVTIAVDTATFAPIDSTPGNQSTVNLVPTGIVPGAGAVQQDEASGFLAKWGPWIAGGLLLAFVFKRKRG